MSRLGLAAVVAEVVGDALNLAPCGIPGCKKRGHGKARCETCNRVVCASHGFGRLGLGYVEIVCASCVIDENEGLLE